MLKTTSAALLAAVMLIPGLCAASDAESIVRDVTASPGGPEEPALTAGLAAYEHARRLGVVSNARLLTLIDYARPSVEPRLWVVDLATRTILYRELVAHGRGSGENMATAFSNASNTLKSSLGLFVTGDTYLGRNGYSLRLRGLDIGVNDHAYERDIVIHGATYVSQAVVDRLGRLGRSWGCPAVRSEIARPLIDEIKGGSVVYVYGGGMEPPPASRASAHARMAPAIRRKLESASSVSEMHSTR